MIFRWSLWGLDDTKDLELLKYSIKTFKYFFGNNHRYVVSTDNVILLKEKIDNLADIISFDSEGNVSIYNIDSKATWKKWCPNVRLDILETEIYIDSDVFLLKYPREIYNIINNPKIKFAILDEYSGSGWQHGAMQNKTSNNTPFINAGLFIQKPGFSISKELEKELSWWKKNVSKEEQTHHDEQGALAIALTPYFLKGELAILPKDKYLLIGPNENNDIKKLDNIVMFHAVYPTHPAFYKFKKDIDNIIKA